MIIAGVVALIFVLRIIFLAPELTNSLKVIQLTSQILRECDNAVIRCSGCLTGSFPTTAQGSDVQDDGDESKEADEPLPSSCNTSPLLIFPVLNALFLLGVFAFWCTVFVYLVSMGELKQNCMCGVSLNDCTCERYFQFDWGMRWSVLFHFYGLLWTCGIVLSVSETMFSTVISTWYFSEYVLAFVHISINPSLACKWKESQFKSHILTKLPRNLIETRIWTESETCLRRRHLTHSPSSCATTLALSSAQRFSLLWSISHGQSHTPSLPCGTYSKALGGFPTA